MRKPKQPADKQVTQASTPEAADGVAVKNITPDLTRSVQMLPPTIKSENYRTIYANHSKMGISQWDFTVILGQMIENSDGKNVLEESIAVKFSPQFFKNFASALIAAVQNWESTFGEIPVGPGQEANIMRMNEIFEGLKHLLQSSENNKQP